MPDARCTRGLVCTIVRRNAHEHIAARFGNGAQIAIGGERGGIGGNFALWTYRARASVPFGAQ
jgi:hypothetical protein